MPGHLIKQYFRTIVLCIDHKVVLFSLPPHTSHVLQPLDKGFFGPLKAKWRSACLTFVRNTKAPVTKFTFGKVLTTALQKSSQPAKIKQSFKACGIWPIDENAVDYSQTIPSQGFSLGSEDPITSITAIQTSTPDDNVQPVIFSDKHTQRVTSNDRSEAAFSSDICNDVLTSSP